jgi:DNA repair protein SbcD/Mre11
MRIIHVSDWHLGVTTYRQDRRPDLEEVLEQTVAHAREYKPHLVIHTGDLFHHVRPGLDDVRLACETLSRLSELAPVVVVCGNHDSPAQLRFLDEFVFPGDHVRFVDVPRHPREGGILEFEVGGERARLAAIPFISGERMVEVFEDPKTWMTGYADRVRRIQQALEEGLRNGYQGGRDILLFAAHLHVTGAQVTRSERPLHVSDSYAAHTEAIPSVSYAAFGHIHKPQRLPGSQLGWYAGSPVALDFGEEHDQKLMLLIDAAPGRPAQVMEVPYTTNRPLRRVMGTLEELLALTDLGHSLCLATVTTEEPTAGLADSLRAAWPDCTLLEVVEDCAARRVEVLSADHGERDKEAERPMAELFADYLAEAGTQTATRDEALAAFERLRAAVEANAAPDFSELEITEVVL